MATSDWWPSSFEGQLELAKKWKTVLAANGTAWGVPAERVSALDGLIAGCETADALVRDDDTRANRAGRRVAYKDLEDFCRETKRLYLNEPPRTEREIIGLGLKPRDLIHTRRPPPGGFAELTVTYPGPHTVTVHVALAAGSPPDPEGSNYGVRLYWGLMPHGGAAIEAALGPKRELTRPPVNGDELPHSVFFRGKKKTLDFSQEDSGKTLYLCARYENSKGEAGGWGVMINVVIP
jgi:hypothetical protein